MRLVIQRVKQASVSVAPDYFRRIDGGLMVLVGIENGDTPDDVAWLVKKTIDLRIFNDDQGIMNRSVLDTGGAILAISQFTLLASTRKGNRPSYINSAPPAVAEPLYRQYCEGLEAAGVAIVERGIFGADMDVSLINHGPVTIIIDSRLRF